MPSGDSDVVGLSRAPRYPDCEEDKGGDGGRERGNNRRKMIENDRGKEKAERDIFS